MNSALKHDLSPSDLEYPGCLNFPTSPWQCITRIFLQYHGGFLLHILYKSDYAVSIFDDNNP